MPACVLYISAPYLSNICMVFTCAVAEAFPDITKMKAYVASGAGYLQGGLQRENWERGKLQ